MKKLLSFVVAIVALCLGDLSSQVWTDLNMNERVPIKGTSNFQGFAIAEKVQVIPSSVSGDPSIIFVKTTAGLWKSVDEGQNFTSVINESDGVYIPMFDFYVNPRNENEIIVVEDWPNAKIILNRTLDGGLTWTDFSFASNLGKDYTSFALDISNTTTDMLFMTTELGLFSIDLRNANSSLNWQRADLIPVSSSSASGFADFSEQPLYQVYFVESRDKSEVFCYVSGKYRMFQRSSLGEWDELVLNGIPTDADNRDLRTAVGKDGTLYARAIVANKYWIYKHTPGILAEWNTVPNSSTNVTNYASNKHKFLVSPLDDDLLFYNVPTTGALTYFNAKTSSTYQSSGYHTNTCENTHADVRCMAFDPGNYEKLYVGNDGFLSCFNATVVNSSSNASCSDWDFLACKGLTGSFWGGGIATSPDDPNVVVMNNFHNIYSTTNLNRTTNKWEALNYVTGERGSISLIVSSEGENSILVNQHSAGNKKKLTFDYINHITSTRITSKSINFTDNINYIHRDPFIQNTIYVMTSNVISKISDVRVEGGVILFSQADLILPTLASNEDIKAFTISDINNTRMYLATSDGTDRKIYASELDGTDQLVWNSGHIIPLSVTDKVDLNHPRGKSMTVSYKNSNTLFIMGAPRNGWWTNSTPHVFTSTDKGENWIGYKNEGLPHTSTGDDFVPITQFIIAEKGANEALFFGTEEGLFYTNATMDHWEKYGDLQNLEGLNSGVDNGEINYTTNELYVHGSRPRKVGLKCPDVNNLTVSSLVNEGWYEAKDNVTCSINTGNSNKYWIRSTDEIDLGIGFSADPGTDASFFIHGCDGRSTSNGGSILRKSISSFDSEISLDDDISDSLDYVNNIMNIYPNPTSGPFKIKLNLKEEEAVQEILLRDYTGNILVRINEISEGNEVDINKVYNVNQKFIIVELITNVATYSSKLRYGILGDPEHKEDVINK